MNTSKGSDDRSAYLFAREEKAEAPPIAEVVQKQRAMRKQPKVAPKPTNIGRRSKTNSIRF